MTGTPAKFYANRARDIIAAHRDMPGAVLPILHALQKAFGYMPVLWPIAS